MKKIPLIGALLGLFMGKPANSAETITYTYDAKGRLIRVVHTGTTNNNLTTVYTHEPRRLLRRQFCVGYRLSA